MNCSVRVVVVPTKVIKFLLITTAPGVVCSTSEVVVVPTKVIKFLLITTSTCTVEALARCCCTYKGNQIFANHNDIALDEDFNAVVVVPTKVIKFLLITTVEWVHSYRAMLLLYLQR